jgi:hypothetical protein
MPRLLLVLVLALIASATLVVAPASVSAHESRRAAAETRPASVAAPSATTVWHAPDLHAGAPAPGRQAISAARRSGLATAWGLIVALSIVVATALAMPVRVRRGVALTAVVALAWFVFETGEHSTHHLGDERGAARCTVASTAAKIAVADETPASSTVTLAPAPTRVSEIVEKDPAVCPLPVPQGRAPPLPR